jgi:hypoxanthine phosphoribosyltransferase
LTERFIEQELADRILSVRIAQDATTAVVRGGLIYGELEVRAQRKEDAA